MTDPQRDEFEDMLRALTLERSQIREAMGFALDNADAAGEVMYLVLQIHALVAPWLRNTFHVLHHVNAGS